MTQRRPILLRLRLQVFSAASAPAVSSSVGMQQPIRRHCIRTFYKSGSAQVPARATLFRHGGLDTAEENPLRGMLEETPWRLRLEARPSTTGAVQAIDTGFAARGQPSRGGCDAEIISGRIRTYWTAVFWGHSSASGAGQTCLTDSVATTPCRSRCWSGRSLPSLAGFVVHKQELTQRHIGSTGRILSLYFTSQGSSKQSAGLQSRGDYDIRVSTLLWQDGSGGVPARSTRNDSGRCRHRAALTGVEFCVFAWATTTTTALDLAISFTATGHQVKRQQDLPQRLRPFTVPLPPDRLSYSDLAAIRHTDGEP